MSIYLYTIYTDISNRAKKCAKTHCCCEAPKWSLWWKEKNNLTQTQLPEDSNNASFQNWRRKAKGPYGKWKKQRRSTGGFIEFHCLSSWNPREQLISFVRILAHVQCEHYIVCHLFIGGEWLGVKTLSTIWKLFYPAQKPIYAHLPNIFPQSGTSFIWTFGEGHVPHQTTITP